MPSRRSGGWETTAADAVAAHRSVSLYSLFFTPAAASNEPRAKMKPWAPSELSSQTCRLWDGSLSSVRLVRVRLERSPDLPSG
jgi:hypothetical protein